MEEIQREEYLASFLNGETPSSVRGAALKEAREVRKFEIDLYWKRATYFWVFIAAAFGGYSALGDKQQTLAFLTACLGFIFSLAWYFVNRGSKFWQQNWEMHVDLLEDDISGPVYKTVIQRSKKTLCRLNGPYPFSVSKINQLLSLFVTIVWLMLIGRTFSIIWGINPIISPRCATTLISIFTFVAAIVLFRFGRTEGLKSENEIGKFYRSRRTYK